MFKTIMYALKTLIVFKLKTKKWVTFLKVGYPRETILKKIVSIKSYRTNQKPSIGLNNSFT